MKSKSVLLPVASPQESRAMVRAALASGAPTLFARFGAVEIKAVLYKQLPPPIHLCLRKYVYTNMPRNAGFFPCNEEMLSRYYERMKADAREVDFLGSWRPEEVFFRRWFRGAKRVSCFDVTGVRPREGSWTGLLEGKKVLVVSPFAESIRRQYDENRERIYPAEMTLPRFAKLETVTAVQSVAGNTGGFASWFEALEWMEREISRKDFDIALLGCGAYGFCLAAHCKRMGKQALHLGGDLQLHFGIKGQRWDGRNIYNEYWIRPSESERPQGLDQVEGGCYW